MARRGGRAAAGARAPVTPAAPPGPAGVFDLGEGVWPPRRRLRPDRGHRPPAREPSTPTEPRVDLVPLPSSPSTTTFIPDDPTESWRGGAERMLQRQGRVPRKKAARKVGRQSAGRSRTAHSAYGGRSDPAQHPTRLRGCYEGETPSTPICLFPGELDSPAAGVWFASLPTLVVKYRE
ncbi:hypothetical protein MRX96_002760 [Rhipicephalus microplus]